jgi:hypothetical protein
VGDKKAGRLAKRKSRPRVSAGFDSWRFPGLSKAAEDAFDETSETAGVPSTAPAVIVVVVIVIAKERRKAVLAAPAPVGDVLG